MRGGAWLGCARVLVPVPGTSRYKASINDIDDKRGTVNTILLSLANDSASGLENCMEKSSPSILKFLKAASAKSGLFYYKSYGKTEIY